MKFQYITNFAALAAVTAAGPHHLHRRAHELAKRDARPDNIVYAPAATETKIIYWLDGHAISDEEAHQGIANGTLEWGDDGVLSTSTNGPVALPTPMPTPKQDAQEPKATVQAEPKPKHEAPAMQEPKESPPPDEQPSSDPAPSSSPESPPEQSPDNSSRPWADLVDENGYCSECGKEFPNGEISCTDFPYGYGALPLKNEGLGGWSGIQDPKYRGGDGFDAITTVVKGSCSDGTCCTAGSFCSYGCPNPYLKASFPSMQGRTGQTVGGLYCNDDGFLEMADGSIAKSLCVPGSKSMGVKVQNKLKKTVSFCRTDYPGTESMTFPVTVGPGKTSFVANPDQLKYFFWKGQKTSAQYYVNKQGVSENEACTWGEILKGKGNWAPAVFGTSFDDGTMHQGFASLKQNELCKKERLGYDITFVGDGVVSACRYKSATNQWCQGNECWDDVDRGCTAAILHGDLTVVLSEG